MGELRVFTFSPDWGLPSAGPFAIKLLAWLELAGISYEQVIEDNPRMGPARKNPWVELDGRQIGDSEHIIELLSQRHNVNLEKDLSSGQRAVGHAWRRTFEEHFHQVLEWELLLHPAGASYMRASLAARLPPVVGRLAFRYVQSHFRSQLYARGLTRHAPEIIAAKGRSDVDALAAFLGNRSFLIAERPTMADTAIFGLLAPMAYWPMPTPVASYIRSIPNLIAYCERMREACFGKRGLQTFKDADA